jgi:hypothetical protein
MRNFSPPYHFSSILCLAAVSWRRMPLVVLVVIALVLVYQPCWLCEGVVGCCDRGWMVGFGGGGEVYAGSDSCSHA